MIDDALRVGPGGHRGGQRMVGIALDRTFQQVQRVRVAVGIERENTGHRPQRQIVRAQIGVRLAAGAIDLGEAQARLQGSDDLGGQLLVERSVVAERAVATMRRQMPAGFGVDQPEGEACLLVGFPDGAGQTVGRRAGSIGNGHAGPHQGGRELIREAAREVGVLRAGVDRIQRDGWPVAAGDYKRRHRRQRVGEDGLPFQGLRRRFAIATAVLDRKPPEMRKAAAKGHIHYLGIRQALQQFAPCALESDVAKGRAGSLAEKDAELPLQGSTGYARGVGKLGHAPVAPGIGAHRVERATDAARQQTGARRTGGAGIHWDTPTISISNTEDVEKFPDRDGAVANWTRERPPPI